MKNEEQNSIENDYEDKNTMINKKIEKKNSGK